MNFADVIVIVIIIAILILIVYQTRSRKSDQKGACGSCHRNCGSCHSFSNVYEAYKKDEEQRKTE